MTRFFIYIMFPKVFRLIFLTEIIYFKYIMDWLWYFNIHRSVRR